MSADQTEGNAGDVGDVDVPCIDSLAVVSKQHTCRLPSCIVMHSDFLGGDNMMWHNDQRFLLNNFLVRRYSASSSQPKLRPAHQATSKVIDFGAAKDHQYPIDGRFARLVKLAGP